MALLAGAPWLLPIRSWQASWNMAGASNWEPLLLRRRIDDP
jgi:hypothetical protein